MSSGAGLLGSALPWVVVVLRDAGATEVPGSAAAPAATGLALSGLALAGALALAPTAVRMVLGALQLILGGTLAAVCLPTLIDPVGRSVGTVSGITGVAGDVSVRALVASASPTAWPVFTLAAGVLAAAAGFAVLITARRWPVPGARYGSPERAATAQRGPADDWDSLSRGSDPTADPAASPDDPGESRPGGRAR